MRAKYLFFDIGYTLVDETKCWRQRCIEQSLTVDAVRCGLSPGDIYREIENAAKARLPQYKTVVQKYQFQTVAPYRSELETLYEHAPLVLQKLSTKYKLGIIANQSSGLLERLREWRISDYFSVIVSSSDNNISKPDPRLFEKAIELANCRPRKAIMIGDRLDNDIIPAKSVGMRTIWVKQGFGALQTPSSRKEKPDFEVDSLLKLLDILL